MAAQRGVQHIWSHADPSNCLNLADREICIFESQRMALGITHENLRQRTNLHRFTVKTWSLHPGIFLVAVPAGEGWLGLSDPGMQSLPPLIVGVRHIFANRVTKLFVGCGLEWMCTRDISIHRSEEHTSELQS